MKIGFVGCGNMAHAIIGGIISKGIVAAQDIYGSNSREASARAAAQDLGINTTTNNCEVVDACDIIVLSVKPQMYEPVIAQIKDNIRANQLIITIAPGKTIAWLEEQFGKPIRLIRAMPNTPALVGEGLTCYVANSNATEDDIAYAVSLFESYGSAMPLPEKLIDVESAVGGSTPAFVYMFIEALADGGVAEGLPRDAAIKIAAQAVLGSAKMVLETGEHPGALKDKVCSPSGSTIKGVEQLELRGFRGTTTNAIRTSAQAAKRL